jgi:FKBP-type peptidyl-prolyl cis-trans isomerase
MKKRSLLALVAIAFVAVVSCSPKGDKSVEHTMQNAVDSVSYAMGMNIALNLYAADSTLNVEAVCQAVRDVYQQKTRMNADEARYAFMKYMNFDVYERTKEMEHRYLEDLRKADRKFVATTSGVTYKVVTLGEVKRGPRSSRDTVVVNYKIFNVGGEMLDSTYVTKSLRTTLGKLPKGVQEVLRLIGPGGSLEVWVPSALAYSSGGCDSIGVKPNTMLFYDLKLKDVPRR